MPRVSSYRLLDVQASRMGAATGLRGVLVQAPASAVGRGMAAEPGARGVEAGGIPAPLGGHRGAARVLKALCPPRCGCDLVCLCSAWDSSPWQGGLCPLGSPRPHLLPPWGPVLPSPLVLAPLGPGGGGRSRTSRCFCFVCFGANSLILKI